MAKKRKAAARADEPQAGPEFDPKESRKRIRTYEDVADSDDEFHLNQDEIRLGEDSARKRQRKWAEQEEFLQPSDEEVLGYSEDEEDEPEYDAADSRAKSRNAINYNSEGSDDERDDVEDDEDPRLGWGMSKEDIYGADAIETEEQAAEEEAEALRLQRRGVIPGHANEDFDDTQWRDGDLSTDLKGDKQQPGVDTTATLQVPPDLGPAERLKLLKERYPEFEMFSRDLLDLQEEHANLAGKAGSSPLARAKLRAASAYIGALTMYFSLLTSTASETASGSAAMSYTQLRQHPVMDSLMQCLEVWTNLKRMPDDIVSSDNGEAEDDEFAPQNEDGYNQSASQVIVEASKPKKTRAERHAEAAKAAADQRRAERLKRTEADLADLDALIATTKKRPSSKSQRPHILDQDDSDLGEEAPLTAREAADKAQRKKSLRFYTSQIAQKANKRGAAGRNAGGDDDIPHRERLKDRQARLNAEAENRGKRGADIGDDLGGESDEEDRRQAQQIRAEAEDDDYYDMVAARTAKKKSDKAALSEAQRQAALQGGRVIEEETVGEDGKRKISYAIEKNKGLTPHRKKDVRNPRVKKRKKYDEKKKKLASIKPVYKGGEGRGGYGGELTGIKKGLVKSTKLS